MEIETICNYRGWRCNEKAKYRKIFNYKSSTDKMVGMNEWLYCEQCWEHAKKSGKGLFGTVLDFFDKD